MAQEHQTLLHQLTTVRLVIEASQLDQKHHSLSLEDFMRHNPSKFNRRVNPDKVDRWVRDFGSVEATQCVEERKLPNTIYKLTNEAKFQWISMTKLWQIKEKMRFGRASKLDLWRSISLIMFDMQKNEFMQLEQENLSVTEICYQVQTSSHILYPSHNLRVRDANNLSFG